MRQVAKVPPDDVDADQGRFFKRQRQTVGFDDFGWKRTLQPQTVEDDVVNAFFDCLVFRDQHLQRRRDVAHECFGVVVVKTGKPGDRAATAFGKIGHQHGMLCNAVEELRLTTVSTSHGQTVRDVVQGECAQGWIGKVDDVAGCGLNERFH